MNSKQRIATPFNDMPFLQRTIIRLRTGTFIRWHNERYPVEQHPITGTWYIMCVDVIEEKKL